MNKRQHLAQQNREILLEAAVNVFRRHGIHAPLELIIQEAQLGRATFYRNFADRRALVFAMMQQALQQLEYKATYFSQYPDGLIQLMQQQIHSLPDLTALMEYKQIIAHDDPALQAMEQQRHAILQPLIEAAIAHKHCRADFKVQDFAIISVILSTSLQGLNYPQQIQRAERALELLIHGIQA